MKKIILPLFLILLSSPSFAQQNIIQFNTYVAPPINTFSRLILKTFIPTFPGCEDGTVYLDSNYDLHVCWNGAVIDNPSPWILDESNNTIYLKESDTIRTMNVGIGTPNTDAPLPTHRLHLSQANVASPSNFNSITMDPADTQDNFGINLKIGAAATAANSNSARFVLQSTNTNIGYIHYYDPTGGGRRGLGFRLTPNLGRHEIWIDENSGNTAINIVPGNFVNYRLTVASGNLKTNRLYLTFGASSAQLKAVNIGGTYYAELMP